MADPPPAPLNNDPAREAVDSLRGYSYQVLRSIQAWIELAEGEILVLEGAEDLDRLDGKAAIVEQVKDTAASGNITLRSSNVVEAIENLWHHQRRNSVPISFRYLTTSGIGREKGSDLNLVHPGLEVWEAIRSDPSSDASRTAADEIRKFVADRAGISKYFKHWLDSADAVAFISRIVQPLAWVTGNGDIVELRRAIEARLVEVGQTIGVSPADAIASLAALHLEAWTVATDRGRAALRRGDVLRIMHAAGSTSIPNSQLLQLIGSLVPGAKGSSTDIASVDRTLEAPPRLMVRRHPRPIVEASLTCLLATGTTHIVGSTGMGKTALAAAALPQGEAIGWVSLRDLDRSAMTARLDAVASVVEARAQRCVVVLDDLEAGSDPRSLLPVLGRLRSVIDGIGGSLLITSSQALAPRVASALGVESGSVVAPPAFEPDDIRDYLVASGCGEGHAGNWSKLIHATTSGHPQLVDARVSALREAGFPPPDLSELITTPPEIVDVRAEARRMVSALGENDRELLCRASLLTGRVSRKRLIAIAGIQAPIPEPGDVIDRLTGPWLETTDTADVRPSPLLRNLGHDTRGADWVRTMHAGIAWAFVASRNMFATEVSDVLLHGMLGNTAGPLVQLMPSLLQASDDVWKQIGETCSMYAEIAVTEDTALPFTHDVDAAAFRILQLRISSQLGAEKVSAIAERALAEARGRAGAAELRVRYFDFLFLWQYLTQAKNDMPLRRVVELSLKFIRLSAELGAEFREVHDLADPEAEHQWPDLSPFLKLILFPAIVDVTTLNELLDMIGELGGDDRALIVGTYADDDDGAAFTLDRIWLAEARLASPNWKGFATTLEQVLAVAGDHQIGSLVDAAAAMVVRVIDENVGETDGALECADRLIDVMGRLPRLLAAKATALTRAERPADAIPLYSEALDRFPLGPPWLTDAYRAAAIGAARAGQWDRSAGWFGEAVSSLDDAEPLARRAGLEFDRGLALHKAGRTPAAVQAFGRAVGMHVESGEEVPAEPLLSARQMGSHAIKLLLHESNGRPMESDQPVFPEFVGRCSSLETLNWGSQKAADLDVVIASLAELDLLVDPNAAITIGLAERLRETKIALAGVAAGQILLRLAVRTLDVRSIVKDALRQLRFLSSATSARAEGKDVAELRLDPRDEPIAPENVILIAHAIVAAATAMVAAGRGRLLPFAEWRSDLPLDASFDELRVDLDDACGVFQGDAYIWLRVVGGNATWVQHVMAALAFLARGRSTPDELLIAHSVAAGYLDQRFLRDLVCDPVSAMVTDTWLAACDSPAQLVSPRFSVPAIRSAVTGTQSGWARVKAVLEAATSAVSAETARNIRPRVDKIRS